MAEGKKESKKRAREEKGDVGVKKSAKKQRKDPEDEKVVNKGRETFLAAKSANFDPTLSSLFASSTAISKPVVPTREEQRVAAATKVRRKQNAEERVENDVELSSISEEASIDGEESAVPEDTQKLPEDQGLSRRSKKRKDEHEDLEGEYMQRLAKDERKAIQARKKADRSGAVSPAEDEASEQDEDEEDDKANSEDDLLSEDDEGTSPPPQHESTRPEGDADMQKAQRTAFLSNVSTEAIRSKSARKALLAHLSSFFSAITASAAGSTPHSVESVRFRSTAYATAVPRKAAYARKELMDATTKSTNAYVVYSSPMLSREAARRLNGTLCLDRHLRVDEVAHPAKIDHKRCVFVGNLGFVDDESAVDKANEEDGRGKRHGKKVPADVEEGLWRVFGKCGTVESVRVIRDSKTRVGKGIAYVQFTDQNAVEAAIQYDEKKFPPMLPRKLRVSRAKAFKRNAKPNQESTKFAGPQGKAKGSYVPKLTPEQRSKLGRTNKLFGRAAAARAQSGKPLAPKDNSQPIRTPESFVFEGHRASSRAGNSGLKLGAGMKKRKLGKPTTRSSKRGTAWKAGGSKKVQDE